MGRTRGVVLGVVALVLVGAGGYVAADAYGLVPGVLTLDPPDPTPQPYPSLSVPGAARAADILSGPADDVAEPSGQRLTSYAATVFDGHDLKNDYGLVVVDWVSGERIVDVRGDTARVPASTAKTLTASAAMASLGAEFTARTAVVQGTSAADLVLVGGGDVMLAPGKGDAAATEGHAGLGDLAAATAKALKKQGVTTVHLALDDTLFTGPSVHPHWAGGDVASGFVAPVTPLAVNVARLTDEHYSVRAEDPSMAAAQTLATRLAEQGITVAGDITRGRAPADAVEIAGVDSAPLRDVIAYMLQMSDNTVTEVVGRLVAIQAGLPGDFTHATRAVVAALGEVGLDTSGIRRLDDCSGLSSRSRVSPGVLAELVHLDATSEHTDLRAVLRGVPVAGLEGTLRERYNNTTDGVSTGAGVVRAKTGTLTGVSSLAGVVQDADGRVLSFAVMIDGRKDVSLYTLVHAIDTFVNKLASCGCS